MIATFLIFTLCGQPVIVFAQLPDRQAFYGVGEMSPAERQEFLGVIKEAQDAGKADVQVFAVEQQVNGKVTCGTST